VIHETLCGEGCGRGIETPAVFCGGVVEMVEWLLSFCCVGLLRQGLKCLEKRRRLTNEQAAGSKGSYGIGGNRAYVTGRANDGAVRQVGTDKLARDRKN
jgi:hypothetical protein